VIKTKMKMAKVSHAKKEDNSSPLLASITYLFFLFYFFKKKRIIYWNCGGYLYFLNDFLGGKKGLRH
jgi:hypothetical protein